MKARSMFAGSRSTLCGRSLAVGAVVVLVGGLGVTGCSVVDKVSNVVHDIRGNKALIDAFTAKMQSGQPSTFEVTYVTTGSSPAQVVYGVEPPNGLAFTDTPTGGDDAVNVDIVVNSSGEYSCSPGSGSGPTCQKLAPVSEATENKIFDLYTPAHWVSFLKEFALAAGFAGDKVTSSTTTVNGFKMSCVDFNASGVPGTSTICTTTQGVLGYVRVASDSTSFEITSFSTSPPASLFQLPLGATVTTVSTPTTP